MENNNDKRNNYQPTGNRKRPNNNRSRNNGNGYSQKPKYNDTGIDNYVKTLPKKDERNSHNQNGVVDTHRLKKDILKIVNGDFKDDEIKLQAMTSLYLGTQVEELTKTLNVLVKTMKEG